MDQTTTQTAFMPDDKVDFATAMFKLLGHPLRLRLVEILDNEGEKTVNDLADLTGQSQSTVSLYLNRLKTNGLLHRRRSGNQTYYSIGEPKLTKLLNCLRECPLE
jgi:DNA-binding transcriptional ArsR family regulator